MLTWVDIKLELDLHTTEFKRIYKCLNKKLIPKEETKNLHLNSLTKEFNDIKTISINYYNTVSKDEQLIITQLLNSLRDKLVRLFKHLNLPVKVPLTSEGLLDLNIQRNDSDIDSDDDMAPPTTIEFINAYTKFIPEFDGTFSKKQRFLDALNFIEDVKETNENTAVRLIKTKLTGTARDYITDAHTTIKSIHDTLNTQIKSESTKVLSAKLLNIKQYGKTPNDYALEIENLTHSLKSAYISEGLTPSLADTYSTSSAVQSITKNAVNDKLN